MWEYWGFQVFIFLLNANMHLCVYVCVFMCVHFFIYFNKVLISFFFKFILFYLLFFVFLPFLGPLPWHMEVPRLGI